MKSIYFYINFYLYRKHNEEQRKIQNKKILEDYENELKKDLEDKKKIVDSEQAKLDEQEEKSAQELEDIKKSVESKKDKIADYIITNIMKVNMEFPEMVKKRFIKKKKAKK